MKKSMLPEEIYILEGKRTALGHFLGQYAQTPAPTLAAETMKDIMKTSAIGPRGWETIDGVILGQVLQAAVGQAPARQALIQAGGPVHIPCITVNKVCGSGLEAIIMGAQKMASHPASQRMIFAGGMENMGLAPVALLNTRQGNKFGPLTNLDLLQHDGLLDPYSKNLMGLCAEECAKKYTFTRQAQDDYASSSFKKAIEAQKQGIFKAEISPITLKDKKGDIIIEKDQGIESVDFEKMRKIPPAFDRTQGTITAANASSISDGAALVLLGNKDFRSQAKFRILSFAYHAQDPQWFTTAPIGAMKKALEYAQLSIQDIDYFEINEAFSVVPMVCIQELGLKEEKVNIYGGAIALGHPLGASGARILVTLMNALNQNKKSLGMASLCIGGGEGISMIIEKIQ